MSDKTLIIVTSHVINENILFFCKHGYLDDPNYDFVFVFNNPGLIEVISIHDKSNVKVFLRENIGFDFGGWTYALHHPDINISNYKYFVFLNSSVRGPFLPTWCSELCWPTLFIKKLNNTVKLVGTTINYMSNGQFEHGYAYPHVQSMMFVTDTIGLNIGIKNGIFNPKDALTDLHTVFLLKEIGYSKCILDAGYELDCMTHSINDGSPINDILSPQAYYGIDINPFEVIFFKTNKQISPLLLQRYTYWSNMRAQGYISQLNKISYTWDPNATVHYGNESIKINITDKIRAYIAQYGTSILHKINLNSLVGDPCPGKLKTLYVQLPNIELMFQENNGLLTPSQIQILCGKAIQIHLIDK